MSNALRIGIIGCGAVGLTAAAEAAKHGARVTLFDVDRSFNDAQHMPYKTNSDHAGVHEGWATGYGGTTRLWGGQLWTWRPEEFSFSMEGVPPWPMTNHFLAPYYAKAFATLGLPPIHSQLHLNGQNLKPVPPLDGLEPRTSSWMGRKLRDFSRNTYLQSALSGLERHLGCTSIRIDERTNVVRVSIQTEQGHDSVHDFDQLMLAAGTLSNVDYVRALRPDCIKIGHGFFDHVSARAFQVEVTNWNRFRANFADKYVDRTRLSTRLVRDDQYLEAKEPPLLPAYGHFEVEFPTKPSELSPRALAAFAPKAASAATALLYGSVHRERPLPREASVFVRIDVQQPSRPQNQLSGAYADNTASLQWIVGNAEYKSFAEMKARVYKALISGDYGCRPIWTDDDPQFKDIFHMMGGLSMRGTDGRGATEPSGRLCNSERIYVGGASIFPSGGMANPTITAIALGLSSVEEMVTR